MSVTFLRRQSILQGGKKSFNVWDGTASTIDPDAQAFITAAAITDSTQRTAINNLVVNLKSNGIWAKMKAIYPFVGGTATSHKWNLKDPRDLDAAYRLAFFGGYTHNSNGITGNGTNAYADTFFKSNVSAQNDWHRSVYSRTSSNTQVQLEIGAVDNQGGSFRSDQIATRNIDGNSYNGTGAIPPNEAMIYANADGAGHYVTTRRGANETEAYRNGVSQQTGSALSDALPNRNIYISARNGTAYGAGAQFPSDRNLAFATIGDGLTDSEVFDLYTIVQNYQIDLNREVVSDPDAQAFITAAAITDSTQRTAINNLVVNLKSNGIWAKMKAIYPFVGGTATSHKWNLKDPRDLDAAYRLAFFGGWTHSSTGALPNGTNAYANTFLWHSGTLQRDSAHMSIYTRDIATQSSPSRIPIGTFGANGGNAFSFIAPAMTGSTTSEGQMNGTNYNPAVYTDSTKRGFYTVSRNSSSEYEIYDTGISRQTKINNSSAYSDDVSRSIYIGALNNRDGSGGAFYYTNSSIAFATIGDGLTDAEATLLYNAVQTFQTTLVRNV